MKVEKNDQDITIYINYSALYGCTFKATALAGLIERCFEVPVDLKEGNRGIYVKP